MQRSHGQEAASVQMAVPNLVVAGVEKAGTTSLFTYLGQHQAICASRKKELNYFAPVALTPGRPLPPLSEYSKWFEDCGSARYRLEASPSYWYLGQPVIDALGRTLQDPRIVLSFRDPVQRMWSAYTYLKSMGRLPPTTSIRDYIGTCEDVHRRGWRDDRGHRHTPLSIGRYGDYVGPWLAAFDPSRLRILFAEDLFTDPAQVMTGLCNWLEIDQTPAATFDYGARNETVHPRSYLLARLADTLRTSRYRTLLDQPQLRRLFRRAYRAVNNIADAEVPDAAALQWLEDYYRPSTMAFRKLLLQWGGPTVCPEWASEV